MIHPNSDINETDNDEFYVEPSFSIDDEGRVICEEHSEINRIKYVAENPNQAYLYESLLTCKKCKHYYDDDCYFPKSEINKIEADRLSGEIHCQLCGNKIDRPLTIIHSLYYKNKFGVDIPLICCGCYASLSDNTYIKNTKKRMLFFLISLVISMYFLISYFLTIIMFNVWGILLFLIPFIFWGYISLRDIRNLYFLWKGRKYYDKFYAKKDGKD